MITVSPAGLSTTALVANSASLTLSYSEKFKKPRNCCGSTPLQTTISYASGNTTLNGSSVFVPVIATVTVVYLLNSGKTSTKTFTEVFNVAFQGQTDMPTAVNFTSLGRTSSTYTDCCCNTHLSIDDSITVALA